MAEYGVVLAVITIAVFGALALLSGNIVAAINRVAGVHHLDPFGMALGRALLARRARPLKSQRGST